MDGGAPLGAANRAYFESVPDCEPLPLVPLMSDEVELFFALFLALFFAFFEL